MIASESSPVDKELTDKSDFHFFTKKVGQNRVKSSSLFADSQLSNHNYYADR